MSEARKRCKEYSDSKLEHLRSSLTTLVPGDAIALTFGSYARREASPESDIDYVVISDAEESELEFMRPIENAIGAVVPIEPSAGGAFGKHVPRIGMLRNYGGDQETNVTLTHRLLFLLEGEWLTNKDGFRTLRHSVLEKYVDATRDDHQLALFLLNDIIRYWRTMTVDYMYKTVEGDKPWAIRNIKLTFSRKLMFASGLFSVGMTVDRSTSAKVQLLEDLFDLPVIDRLVQICGAARMGKVLASYDVFLNSLEDPNVRKALKEIEPGNHDNQVFRELKNEGHRFTRELLAAFDKTFHSTHPIRRAVIF